MLRGGSAEARTDLVARLDEASSTDQSRLGEQLFGIASVFRSEPALRRVATDASIEGEAKAGLAASVFGSAVDEVALDLVQRAVQHRWTSPRDLADVLEGLGVVATVRSAGEDGSRIADELFQVRRLVDGQDELRSALSDPARAPSDKGGLLRELMEGKLLPATLLLVEQCVSGTHGAVDQALQEFQHLAAEARGEQVATVHSARDLGDGERQRLSDALGRQYATTVRLQVVVDPDLVGGLRVEIGDDVIDGTVSSKLEDAQRKLAG